MNLNKNEPSDPESPWLKLCKITPLILGIGHLLIEVVKIILKIKE